MALSQSGQQFAVHMKTFKKLSVETCALSTTRRV